MSCPLKENFFYLNPLKAVLESLKYYDTIFIFHLILIARSNCFTEFLFSF